ncbi:parvulin-like peptidyl-prolyl isomerase [Ruminiclostridium sufflavum DSM 19573]|uniref:Parvulin-like peptidyl-prolyl isomerase n=1 Tax=Ruminiclostridium sufflavum DSM 19573 TaxID=1121337 RepID=A0A318XKZ1_9FIRM|nr:stalk domain-containing protein [Ruminiclostridium sufflavum]PYG87860.1 parvulin-like peptidyl-prolyl isomerase [Ruminiclostridium sufflavum DSM 19573]
MKNKFWMAAGLTVLLAGSSIFPSFAAVGNDEVIILTIGKPAMLVSGIEKAIDSNSKVTPVLVNDTTLVPISSIIEAFGGQVSWDSKSKKVTITYNKNKVELWLNQTSALVNGKKVTSTVAPMEINGRTMLPLKFVSQNLGLSVNWEGSTKSISIGAPGDYVASVGSEKIKKAEFNIYLSNAKSYVTNYISQNAASLTVKENMWDTVINDSTAAALVKEMALDYSKEQAIFLSKAKENKAVLSEEDLAKINSSISQIIEQEGSKEAAEKKLQEYYGISLAEYTQFLKDYELANKNLQEEINKITISEDEILKAYENNKAMYDTVTVKHILLLADSDQSDQEQAEIKKKAEEILSKVNAGADFASLAAEYSEDPGSKDSGGEYTFGKGEMVQEFEDWSFQAKEGDTGIIKTSYGYHVMKFVKKSSLEDAKEAIRSQLTSDAADSYMDRLVSEAKYIVVKNKSVFDAIEIK